MKIYSQHGWAPALVTLLALGGMAGGMAACGPHHERVVETRTVVEEHTTAPPKMVDISIENLHDEPAVDPAQERVVGTIVNAGDRSVRGLSIRVEALDRSGNVVTSIVTPPLEHEIDAFGGRTSFEALMPRDPTVTGYHAVAIAR